MDPLKHPSAGNQSVTGVRELRSGGCSLRGNRAAQLLWLLGLGTGLAMSCGGSREPFLQMSSDHGGTMNVIASSTQGGGGTSEATSGTRIELRRAWDYNGIVGTGQSLAVGNTPIVSTKQPYNNLMLALGGATVPPWDSELSSLGLVPLVERKDQTNYPAPYPKNLWGETPHSALANQLTSLVRSASGADFVSVHTIVGESGQGIEALNKQVGDTTGTIGRAYAATLFEVAAIARLAKAAGKTYGVGVIVMTHGETDSGSDTYQDDLLQLHKDYNADLAALTGQEEPIPLFVSQEFAYPNVAGERPKAPIVQWRLGVEHGDQFVCTGPKYQYPGHGDGVHLASAGYMQLGEKIAQVYYERILLGHDWQPLQPIATSRESRVVVVKFHVPVPPLVWEETWPTPTTEWPNGRGFELRSGSLSIGIDAVEIAGDSVRITCDRDLPTTELTLSYAMTAGSSKMSTASQSMRWGMLRDSDPFIGATTKQPQPNYCVAFELAVP